MTPLIPRMHLFEIDDQPWFPSFLRAKVQACLTIAWTFKIPVLQSASPAQLVAGLLSKHIPVLPSWVMIDFCAGGGGPTPSIERCLNQGLTAGTNEASEPVLFVLTDLHPHIENWAAAAAGSPNIRYEPQPVDASAAGQETIAKYAASGTGTRKKVFRLFNLAFHHFDDPLAKAVLKNTVESSDGFGIFELQDRSFASFLTCCIFGIGILLSAPYYIWIWRSPATFIFVYLIPILPFVIVFDGWISGLRTRTPDELEALLRTCGADGADKWEIQSGSVRHLWPCGYLHWIICMKKDT